MAGESKADRIRDLDARAWKATDIAREVGCSRNYVYRVLSNQVQITTLTGIAEQILREIRELRGEIRSSLGLPPRDIIQQRLRAIQRD